MATNGKTAVAVRRSPFAEIKELHDALQDVFDTRWPFSPRVARLGAELKEPAIDMFEREDSVVVKAELPGIEPDKIDVTVADGEVRISGERSEEKEVKDENYYHAERRYGRVFRSVVLPDGCSAEGVSAISKDGVVEVVIPRKATATAHKIEVKSA